MSDPEFDHDDQRVSDRADDRPPEERAAGADDPSAQAAAILADSDDRQADRNPGAETSPGGLAPSAS